MTAKKEVTEIQKLLPWLTVARAAEVAGRSRRTVREWVRQGQVVGERSHEGRGSARLLINTRSLLRLLGVEVAES